MRDTGNQAKYEQLLDDAGLEIRNDDKERNDDDENATLEEVSGQRWIETFRRDVRTEKKKIEKKYPQLKIHCL